MIRLVNKFIEATFASITPAQVGARFADLAVELGFSSTLLIDAAIWNAALTRAVVFATGPKEAPLFARNASSLTSPIMHHAVLVDTPFELKDVCAGQVMRERELRQWLPAKIRNQQFIGLPVHRDGQLVLYAECCGAKPDDSQIARMALHACAHATHDRSGALALQSMLTAREADCLYWLAQGKTYAETGKILRLSERTIRAAVAATKPKLGARSKSEVIAKAVGRAAAS